MTGKRPWPNWAKEARAKAIFHLRNIDDLGQIGKKALEDGKPRLAKEVIQEMQRMALIAKSGLLEVAAPESCASCYLADEREQEEKIISMDRRKRT